MAFGEEQKNWHHDGNFQLTPMPQAMQEQKHFYNEIKAAYPGVQIITRFCMGCQVDGLFK
jgi:hypothetical protein